MRIMNYLVIKTKKEVGKFELATPKSFWIDESACLRSKMKSFKGRDYIKNKRKGFSKSQSKHNKFQENKKCFDERNIK